MQALFAALMNFLGGSGGASAAGSAASGAAGSAGTAAAGSALGEAAGSTLAQGAAQGVANAAPAVVQNAAPAATATTQGGLNGLFGSLGQTGKTIVNASGLGGQAKDILNAETAYTTIKDPTMSLHDKFNKLAPMAYEQAEKGKGQFSQLQQGAIPQPMNMQQLPSYAQPSMPYQGGGIEEILARQRGLLR